MSGTWPTARAAIVAQLNGVTSSAGSGYATKTLTAFEWAPPGSQPADVFPYAFVVPQEIAVGRGPGMFREITVDVRIRFCIAPSGESDMSVVQKAYDAWTVALMDAWDDAATIDGTADISVEQSFSGINQIDGIDHGWGFDMTLGQVRISEEKTFSA